MVQAFIAILASPSRTQDDQMLALFVLDALQQGKQLAGLRDPLEAVIRDHTRWSAVRRRSLAAYLYQYPSDIETPLQIARDIRDGLLEDRSDDLLGDILRRF